MESSLVARDKVGVQDFVLLENFRSEDAFINNLCKRFNMEIIYVSNKARPEATVSGIERLIYM